MQQEPEIPYEQPEPIYRKDPIQWNRVFWMLVGLVVFGGICSYLGYKFGVKAVESSSPKLVKQLDERWGIYQFPDIGVRIELPSHPNRYYAFSQPEADSYYAAYRYYGSHNDVIQVDMHGFLYKRGPSSDMDYLTNIERGFESSSYKVLSGSHEGAVFHGLQAEHVLIDLSGSKGKYEYEGYVVIQGATRWTIGVLELTTQKDVSDKDKSRVFDSVKLGSWGHLP